MDLSLRSQAMKAENQSWLGSAHGTQTGESIALDGALLGAQFTDGVVPSGLLVAKVTATGRYASYDPYTPAADGRQLVTGLYVLLTSVELFSQAASDLGTAYHNVTASGLWHGEIILSKLPVGVGVAGYPDAAAIAALPQIKFLP